MKEGAKHQRAFETYFGMGPDRSLHTVAAKLGVSVAAVKKWSSSFSWQARVAERDQTVNGLVRGRVTKVEVDRQSRNRRIVEAAIVSAARAIADGRVSPSLADLDRMVRLESFLEGEPDSRQEVIHRDLAGKSMEELRTLLDAELSGLGAIDARFQVLDEGSDGASMGSSEK